MSEPSFHDRMRSLMETTLPNPSTAARIANGIAAEADQRIASLEAELAEVRGEANWLTLKRAEQRADAAEAKLAAVRERVNQFKSGRIIGAVLALNDIHEIVRGE